MSKYFVIHENDAGTEAPTDAYCVSLEQEVKRLTTLCQSLVGEETLHQEGQYETEMMRLQTERMNLRTALGEIHHCHTEGTSTLCGKCEKLAAAGMRGILPPTYYEGHPKKS